MPYYNKDPKRDHNFDNHPHEQDSGCILSAAAARILQILGGYCLEFRGSGNWIWQLRDIRTDGRLPRSLPLDRLVPYQLL